MNGITVVKFPVQEFAFRFCKYKKSYIRCRWEGKNKKAKRSIIIERYYFIEILCMPEFRTDSGRPIKTSKDNNSI